MSTAAALLFHFFNEYIFPHVTGHFAYSEALLEGNRPTQEVDD